MRVAIVGAGAFGCTAAILLAEEGHDVTVFEEKLRIGLGASSHNQNRIHWGYHYPRWADGPKICIEDAAKFEAMYPEAVMHDYKTYYAISAKGSRITAGQYINFLRDNGLATDTDGEEGRFINLKKVDCVVCSREPKFSPDTLNIGLRVRMARAGVTLLFGCPAVKGIRKLFDKVILATYHENIDLLEEFGITKSKPRTKYQLVIKPLMFFPAEHWRSTGVVIMDGPFGCVDPHPDIPNSHTAGHVTEAVATTAQSLLDVRSRVLLWGDRVNHGPQSGPDITEYNERIFRALSTHIRIAEAKVDVMPKTSLVTCRAVPAGLQETDARPTDVEQWDEDLYSIMSGKLTACVSAAQTLRERLC